MTASDPVPDRTPPSAPPPAGHGDEHVEISVDRDHLTGGMQLGISVLDEEGGGHGYRISGPKYSGNSKPLLRHTIDERDADEIRRYLDRVSPGAAVGRVAQLEALLADLAVQQPEAVDDYRRRLAAVETLRKGTPDAT